MFINQKMVQQLYNDVEDDVLEEAKKYVKQRNVEIGSTYYEDMNNFSVSASIWDKSNKYKAYVSVRDAELDSVTCECKEYHTHYYACKHIIAMILEIDGNPKYNGNNIIEKHYDKYTEFKEIINTFYEEEMKQIEESEQEMPKIENADIKIEPKIIYDKFGKELKVEFKIGTSKQMYKLRNLTEFYDNMVKENSYKYGTKLEFVHNIENFSKNSQPLINFILKHAEIIKYVNSNSKNGYRYYGRMLNEGSITLTESALDEIFNILKNKTIPLEKDYVSEEVEFLDENPNIQFELEKINEKEYELSCGIETYNAYEIIEGKEYIYFLTKNKLYRCTKQYKETTLKLLEVFRKNYTKQIKFSKEYMSQFFSIVLPKVKKDIKLDAIDEQEIEKYMPQKLGVKVFLEFNKKNYIIAQVKFNYGDEEFNPINENPNIPRNILEEADSLNIFRKTGFMLDRKNAVFVLASDEKIYNFLSEDINMYMKKFEVLATDEFKEKQIKHPKVSALGVKIENNLLTINLEGFNFYKSELKEILQKYKLKKKYHRLKDGTFFTLEENEDINFIENLVSGTDVEYKDITSNTIQLPIYRSLYLNRILNKVKNKQINKDVNYNNIVNSIEDKANIDNLKIPSQLENILRPYQKIGYKWLKSIDEYKFGGILADDMGLGKTLQIIAIILNYINSNEKNKKPIIVVCPSSLSLNWKNEIEKFAPSIQSIVISGNAIERKRQINLIPQYEVIITSYDLLKRDIDIYKELNCEFRYIIADEAQYIKNTNTQNAKAIKQIKGETKYALTGTPIENSLSELWSIIDFLMPGYLFSYRKFKELYEIPIVKNNDEQAMKKLKMLIEPFILRRIKREVLTELPDKTVTILNNEMNEEQQKIYITYLNRARAELKEEIDVKGIENSNIKILALLTRLRQICCHPSLFLDNYKGEVSKLNQCIEIVKDAILSGHKILLFSGYTSMFDIIEKELKKENINYFKLTGQTKVNNRLELVEEFNNNPEVKVFLISLKAGGTGLNLIGADMVIHYDPWWNISAENQATDRTYRIGQKNNVQVYKLITKNSIEEKIYELQEKKAKLIDNVLDTKTSFINKLSKDDIMRLFE